MRPAMQIIRTILLLSIVCVTLGGCTIIRGTAAGPSGDAWYVQARYYTAKVKAINYCPAGETTCFEAPVVSNREFAKITASSTAGGEQ
jgi:hypothetical protein